MTAQQSGGIETLAANLTPSADAVPSLEMFPAYGRVRDVAKFTNLSEATVWRAIWSSDLASTRISEKTVRISREQLREWLERKAAAVA